MKLVAQRFVLGLPSPTVGYVGTDGERLWWNGRVLAEWVQGRVVFREVRTASKNAASVVALVKGFLRKG